ncbi:unnamed protein product [Didymodactylos carnosus]|uniref:HAT C-terminal dimerisation domain-containing protein n=1 Tax=Didymodactylos carnosus TaxID=1234261 RepID=A0A814FAN4_9BILA|nr:unnamed protein product [Didymodactylos carnosus]CAF1453371.1 unnamed protein product [Didymodactylos carnosus]CAF3755649.1 unnamed protein product [Didymodactylos carnosus]CAF4247809.1 unnamed protein product [Didymodactylos carnosus]
MIGDYAAQQSIHRRKECVAATRFFPCCDVNNKTDKNPLLFWQTNVLTMPLLAKMSKLYLATSGTSMSSESAFSLSAYYGRKERSRLPSEPLALSVFLKDKLQQQEDATN